METTIILGLEWDTGKENGNYYKTRAKRLRLIVCPATSLPGKPAWPRTFIPIHTPLSLKLKPCLIPLARQLSGWGCLRELRLCPMAFQ